jgi:sugar O-acyltransferase (sialic acid O-acetyltransferase NeuD family)
MSLAVIIVGAGGHARVIADALLMRGAELLGFTDADPSRHGARMLGLPVLGDDSALARHDVARVVLANGIGGVGGAKDHARRAVQLRLTAAGWRFTTVIHAQAVVSSHAQLGAGVQILAGGIVQVGARIGEGCIVNTAAVVEHDVVLGDYTHVAPRAVVCGDVVIGADCHVGAGCVVRQGLRIADGTVIGVGAVVVKDCGTASVLVGIPARPLEHHR